MRERASRCVCKYCGAPLMIQEVIRNFYGGASLELCCPKCQKIEYGTEPELYLVAKEIVNDMKFSYYDDLEESEQVYQMNIAKVCEILTYCLMRLQLLGEHGFSQKTSFENSIKSNE